MYSLFISDTHLGSSEDGNIQSLVINCIKSYAEQGKLDNLYLLGDIFNFWIGDEQINQPQIQDFLNYLIQLSLNGIKIFIMQGNRDFLMGKNLCNYLNCRLLPDPYILNLYSGNQDIKLLLTHGDLLCTDDKNYQLLRKVVNNQRLQKIFLYFPYKIREKIALYMRKLSIRKQQQSLKNNQKNKNRYNFDINYQALDLWHKKYNFDVLIHGHTHNTKLHKYTNYTRMVLSDWHKDGGTYAVFDGTKLYLKKYLVI